MIIKGRAAGGVAFWGKHLMRDDTNDRAELKEISGLLALTAPDALREMAAIAAGSRSHGNFMYSVNLNPERGEHLTEDQWREAVDLLEKNMKLEGHQRIVVEHEKEGRIHRHVIWNRVDVETLKVTDITGNYATHDRTSREIEERFHLKQTPSLEQYGAHRQDEPAERPPELWEQRAAERSGIDQKEMKAELTELWKTTDSGQAFAAALADHGYILARGDRRAFVVVDHAGDVHSLAKRLEGVKTKDVKARLSGIDRDQLPSADAARDQQRERFPDAAEAWQNRNAGDEPTPEPTKTPSQDAPAPEPQRDDTERQQQQRQQEEARRQSQRDRAAREITERQNADAERKRQQQEQERQATAQQRQQDEKRQAAERSKQQEDARRASEQKQQDAARDRAAREKADSQAKQQDAKRQADQEQWGMNRDAENARVMDGGLSTSTPRKSGLKVAGGIGGVAMGLADFVTGFLAGSSKEPKPPQSQVDKIKAQRRAFAALERIEDSIRKGEDLSPADVKNLTPTNLENIRLNGDEGMKQLINLIDRDRDREKDGWGRERER